MPTPLVEEFRREADSEANPSLGSILVSAAVLLEHIAQTQEVSRGSCIELSTVMIGLADEPRLRSRFTVIRGAFSRGNSGPPPHGAPAGHGTSEAPAPYVVTE